MRGKKYLSMLILASLVSLAIVTVPPAQSSPSPVTFYVDRNPPTGYIPGVSVNTKVSFNISIDASDLTNDAAGSMDMWGMDIQVDPSVLNISRAIGAGSGYFLWEFANAEGYDSPTLMQGTRNYDTGYWDELSEMIMGDPATGAGGTGLLVTLNFTSMSETGYSWVKLLEAEWRDTYGTWHDAEVVYGHYNSPKHLHSKSGLIDLEDPEHTNWLEIYPTFSNNYFLDHWEDNDDGNLSRCDQIAMIHNDTEDNIWFHVDNVTVTMNTTICTGVVSTVSSPSTKPLGMWFTAENAYSSSDTYAWCNTEGWIQRYGTYGFNLPSTATIISVKVGLEAYTAGDDDIDVRCSWDGGQTNWAAPQTHDMSAGPDPNAVTWFDFTGAVSWAPDLLSDANFVTEVTYVTDGKTADINYLDWIPVNVTYWILTATTNPPSSVPTGTWTSPTDAYSSNNAYASTGTDEAEQEYGYYGFNIPGGATITKVEVGYEAHTHIGTNEEIGISCSWGSGAGGTWATEVMTGSLPDADPDAVTWVDFTGAITWKPENLTDAKFRTRVSMNLKGGSGAGPVYLDYIPVRVTHTAYSVMLIEFEGDIQNFNWANPEGTIWHEIYPGYCNQYNLTSFLIDHEPSGNLTVCDGIILKDLATGVAGIAHVDGLATDITVAYKYPQPPWWPEFPLGVAVEISLIVAIAYIWLRSRRKTKITKSRITTPVSQ